MRCKELLVLALAGVVAVGCERDGEYEDDATPGAETTPAEMQPTPTTPEGVTDELIVSRDDFEEIDGAGDLDVKGFAELRRSSAATEAGLELHARLEGLKGEHAWHIHRGECSVKDAPMAIPLDQPLLAASDGVAEQTLALRQDQLTMQQLESEKFSVRVHAGGAASPGAAIACADLERR